MKIGFFDSGLGGLTVLKEAIENENLREEIVYLGDTKNTPYGVKDKEYVKTQSQNLLDTIYDLNPNK